MDLSKLAGGCACGAVRYTCSAAPVFTLNCHCRDCQRISGAPFVSGFIVPSAAIDVRGDVRWFETTAESGATAKRGFCPACGTALFAESTGASAAFRSVRAASLDDASWFKPAADIFTRSAQSWASSEASIPKFEGSPPM
jgi:hypothetical protein